jgi:hypothetical protein
MHRRFPIAFLAALVSLTTLAASPAAAAPPIIPRPLEPVLSDAERRLAVESMSARERASVGAHLADGAPGLAVSYQRHRYRMLPGLDGTLQPVAVPSTRAEDSALVLPAEAVADASYATKPGTDLIISLLVVRTRGTSPFEWMVVPYAEWSGIDGMHPSNSAADSLAVAWAGGAYVYRQSGEGQRVRGWPCNGSDLDLWPSDGSPNTGTAWSFHEWGWWSCPAWWATADIRIRQKTWANRTDNIVFKYFHTYSGREYSISFSRTPSVTMSPTNEQWALVLFGTYAH